MPLLDGHGIIFCGIEPAVRKEGGNSTVFPDGAVFPAARHCNRSAKEQINIEDAHRRLLADLLIPYLDTQDFHKTPSIFQAGKNDFFQTRMGASDCVACAAAWSCSRALLMKRPTHGFWKCDWKCARSMQERSIPPQKASSSFKKTRTTLTSCCPCRNTSPINGRTEFPGG